MDLIGKRMLKITVLGANKSGKTALTVRFLTGKFIFDYKSGTDEIYHRKVRMPSSSTQYPLEIVDTSCNENIKDAIYGTDGVIIVYAINNKWSFQKAKEMLGNVDEFNGKSLCTALVASKTDLWQYKSVPTVEGKDLAAQYNCKYFEISALTNKDAVKAMFYNIINWAADKIRTKGNSRNGSLPLYKTQLKFNDPRPRSQSLQMTKKETKQKRRSSSQLVHKTLGDMGHIAFSSIALPLFPNTLPIRE